MRANRKLKPFIQCSVAAYSQLKRLLATRWDRLDTQAMVANRAPVKTTQLLQAEDLVGEQVNSPAFVATRLVLVLRAAWTSWR